MKAFGIIILIVGILLGAIAFLMDTTVESGYGQVNNIGLMRDQQIYLIIAGILSIIGIIILGSTRKKSKEVNKYPFKITIKQAKIAEYKGNIKEAIDKYMETLYHLENDYKNIRLEKQFDESRIKLIETVKLKVEKLKAKN